MHGVTFHSPLWDRETSHLHVHRLWPFGVGVACDHDIGGRVFECRLSLPLDFVLLIYEANQINNAFLEASYIPKRNHEHLPMIVPLGGLGSTALD
jgi:hypothetical protein